MLQILFKTVTLLIVVINVCLVGNAFAAFESDFESVGNRLCVFLSDQQSKPDVDQLFSDEIFNSVPKDKLLKLLQEQMQQFGDCRQSSLVEVNVQFRVAHLSLVHTKGQVSITRLGLAGDGKINELGFKLKFSIDKPSLPVIKKVRMHDGTQLETWIFLNSDFKGKLPVVLERTPYSRMGNLDTIEFGSTAQWVWSQGYHFIVQAVRGTGRSEGDFEIFSPINVADAQVTLDWIDKQSFSNGNVAVMGTSYDGFTALAAGITNHKTLKLVLAGGAPSNLATDGFNSNGVLQLVLMDYLRYIESRQGVPFELNFIEQAEQKLLTEPDSSDYDRILFGFEIKEWNRIAPHINRPESEFWQTRSIYKLLPRISVPTYHIAGMAVDGDMPDTVRNFRKSVKSAEHPERHHLYLGYWDHGNSTPSGSEIGNLGPDLKERLPAILAHYLAGEPLPFPDHQIMIASHHQKRLKPWAEIPFENFPKKNLFVRKVTERNVELASTPAKYAGLETKYWYRPTEIHGFTKDQHVALFWQADQEVPVLGELEFNILVATKAAHMDVMVAVSKVNAEGEPQFVSNCLFAKRFEVQKNPEALKLTGDCPVFTKVKKGEILQFVVTSNLFPQFTRVNTDPSGLHALQDFEISLLWSPEVPFVSVPMEIAQ